MRIDTRLTDVAVLKEVGERLARWRLENNLSQADFGEEAGLGRRTVQRLEAGESVQLSSLIRVLRVLGLLESLDRLIPEPVPSPIERLKLAGRERQRARGRRSSDSENQAEPWAWGADTDARP